MNRTKFYLTVALSLVAFLSKAQECVDTDTVATALDEVVVTADSQVETAKKVIVRPSKLDKKHSL